MSKPNYVSHYLVLKDLIDGIDPRQYNDITRYLTSRIENIKCDLKEYGLMFDENAVAHSTYSTYKPYILLNNEANTKRAKTLLSTYYTRAVEVFLNRKKDTFLNKKSKEV